MIMSEVRKTRPKEPTLVYLFCSSARLTATLGDHLSGEHRISWVYDAVIVMHVPLTFYQAP